MNDYIGTVTVERRIFGVVVWRHRVRVPALREQPWCPREHEYHNSNQLGRN